MSLTPSLAMPSASVLDDAAVHEGFAEGLLPGERLSEACFGALASVDAECERCRRSEREMQSSPALIVEASNPPMTPATRAGSQGDEQARLAPYTPLQSFRGAQLGEKPLPRRSS